MSSRSAVDTWPSGDSGTLETVRVNGRDIGEFPSTDGKADTFRSVIFTDSYDQETGRLSVEFVNPSSPAWANSPADGRTGFTLQSIEIHPKPEKD